MKVSWDGLWTPSFELSQFHGHGSWVVCEVAVIHGPPNHQPAWLVGGPTGIGVAHRRRMGQAPIQHRLVGYRAPCMSDERDCHQGTP